jgi:hypothetical protein
MEQQMSAKSVLLTYGTEKIKFHIDSEFIAGDVIAPRQIEATCADTRDIIRKSLQEPVGSKKLHEMVAGKKVCLVLSDDFRAGLQVEIGECLLEEIARGKPSHVCVICATGSHDPEIYSKRILHAMEDVSKRIGLPVETVWHHTDNSLSIEAGKTSFGTRIIVNEAFLKAEVRVFGHEAKHHYMAGYSCIDKQVIPGVSMRKTIEMNHKLSLDEDARAGNISWHSDPTRQRNPFSADAREARKILEKLLIDENGNLVNGNTDSFAIDMISEKNSILWLSSGNPDDVSKLMPEQADKFGEYSIKKQKYVIISPGGPPACEALYGTQNCFDIALLGAIEQGGEALIIAPCNGREDLPDDVRGLAPGRASKELFYDNLVNLQNRTLEECEKYVDEHFQLYLWKTIRVLRLSKKYGIKLYLHSELPDESATSAGFIPVDNPQQWIDERSGNGDGKLTVIDGGNKLLVRGV